MKTSQKDSKKKIVLLDAHAIIHRAYHGMPDFSSSSGEPTGALYGICTMLFRIIETFRPYQIIACYDLPGGTFRHEAYADYKGTRSDIEDNLKTQLNTSREIFEAFHIPILDAPGFEADDVLGTLVQQITEKHGGEYQVIICSGDMDTMQLIAGDDVIVFTLKKGLNDVVTYNEQAVIDRYNFTPSQIPDYKGLRGDTSDNIPGVPGIGEKIATDLIVNFKTLENMYQVLDTEGGEQQFLDAGIKPRIINLLHEHREGAEFSKILATIRSDAPVTFDPHGEHFGERADRGKIIEMFKKFEFKSLANRLDSILGGGEKQDLTPSPSPIERGENTITPERQAEQDKLLFECGIMVWILDSNMTNPDRESIENYTGIHGDITKMHAYLTNELHAMGVMDIYEHIEQPLTAVIVKMQNHGVKLDKQFLSELSVSFHNQLKNLETEIYEMTGNEFNINSPKQLGEVLFEKMKIQEGIKGLRIKKTKSGTYSTAEAELEKFRDHSPVIGKLLQYRELQKLVSTYIDTLPTYCDEHDRIHARFIQNGAATGRFASADPNLQNIPQRSSDGTEIRRAFIAETGKKLLVVDYSQIELRIAAMLSGDEGLKQIFQDGTDIHTGVAAKMFHVPEGEVTQAMRRDAKVINFGILYGMGITALQQNLGSTRAEAQAHHDAYFREFPKLREYMDESVLQAKKLGYSQTMFGRRRYFPGLQSHLPFIRAAAERAAINAPIQGTQADVIKLAMIHIDRRLMQENMEQYAHMIMQIHDELVFEIDPQHTDQVTEIIRDEMVHVFERSFKHIITDVPLNISVGIGDDWASAK
jgi:DNA polymerase-1